MSAIEVKNVSMSYGSKPVLHNISLNIEKGSIYGLIGPSGCGKSTLVKIIIGLLTPKSGQVIIDGEQMPSKKIVQKMGYMAQAAALYTMLSGKENLEFFGKLYGLKGKKLKERVKYVSELVNLSGELKKNVGNYSGGMQQRLSLATALIHEPEILVLDEPTVGIDPLLRYEIWKELRALTEKGITILITTHVMDEAQKCDRLAMIRGGRILATGTAESIVEEEQCENLEEVFLKLSRKDGGYEN